MFDESMKSFSAEMYHTLKSSYCSIGVSMETEIKLLDELFS